MRSPHVVPALAVRLAALSLTALLSACAADDGGSGPPPPAGGAERDSGPNLQLDVPSAVGGSGGAAGDAALEAALSDAAGGTGSGDATPRPACADEADNDADGVADFPEDPGCTDAADDDETDPVATTQCSNGLDDDDDGQVDVADTDCVSTQDPTEQGDHGPAECSNAADDDADGVTDFPDEPGCEAAGDGSEEDPATPAQCSDGLDNDDNGLTDYPEDPGCPGRGTAVEGPSPVPPACSDGQDNDADGATDYPDDPDCVAAGGVSEAAPGGCGGSHRVIDLNRALAGAEFVDGDTSTGAEGFVGSCGGRAGPEVIYSYTIAEVVGAVEFTTEYPETTVPTVIYVRPECGDPRDLGCNRGSDATPGTHVRLDRPEPGTYFVVVDTSAEGQTGAFRLGVVQVAAPRCSDARDNDTDGAVDLLDPGCTEPTDDDEADPPTPPECADGLDNDGDGQTDYPADETCEAAGGTQEIEAFCQLAADLIIVGSEGGVVHSSTAALGSNYRGSCGGDGPEQIIALLLEDPASVTVQILNNTYDTLAWARRACDDAGTELDCDDDGGGAAASSRLEMPNLDAGVYYIFIDGFS